MSERCLAGVQVQLSNGIELLSVQRRIAGKWLGVFISGRMSTTGGVREDRDIFYLEIGTTICP